MKIAKNFLTIFLIIFLPVLLFVTEQSNSSENALEIVIIEDIKDIEDIKNIEINVLNYYKNALSPYQYKEMVLENMDEYIGIYKKTKKRRIK